MIKLCVYVAGDAGTGLPAARRTLEDGWDVPEAGPAMSQFLFFGRFEMAEGAVKKNVIGNF